MHRALEKRRADKPVPRDRPCVDVDAEQFAVPFGQDALLAACIGSAVVGWQWLTLHPVGCRYVGDRAEGGRQVDQADRTCHD